MANLAVALGCSLLNLKVSISVQWGAAMLVYLHCIMLLILTVGNYKHAILTMSCVFISDSRIFQPDEADAARCRRRRVRDVATNNFLQDLRGASDNFLGHAYSGIFGSRVCTEGLVGVRRKVCCFLLL